MALPIHIFSEKFVGVLLGVNKVFVLVLCCWASASLCLSSFLTAIPNKRGSWYDGIYSASQVTNDRNVSIPRLPFHLDRVCNIHVRDAHA